MVPKFLEVSNWSLFLLKRLKFALSIKSRLTPLEGVPRVSSLFFKYFYFYFFEFFFIFLNLKKIKKMPRVKLSSCHVAVKVMWQ